MQPSGRNKIKLADTRHQSWAFWSLASFTAPKLSVRSHEAQNKQFLTFNGARLGLFSSRHLWSGAASSNFDFLNCFLLFWFRFVFSANHAGEHSQGYLLLLHFAAAAAVSAAAFFACCNAAASESERGKRVVSPATTNPNTPGVKRLGDDTRLLRCVFPLRRPRNL